MAYNLIWKKKGIIINFSGIVNSFEIVKVNSIIYGDPRFDSMEYQLCDFSNVQKGIGSEKDARMIGALDKSSSRWNRHIKVICVTKDTFAIEMIQAYASMLKDTGWEVIIVDDFDTAWNLVKSFKMECQ